MFVKKMLLSLVVIFTVLNVFFVSTFAARSGEVERGYIEFEAFTPDDFTDPIEIQLAHKEEGYVLKYYLYKINNYFLNEAVPCGDYDVSINVGERQDEFTFIYENSLLVESGNLAIPFNIIMDYTSLEGDASIQVNPNSSNEDEGKINISEEKDDTEKQDLSVAPDKTSSQDSQEENSSKSPYSVLISFGFSLLLLLVVAFVMWKFKNR